MRKIFSRSLAVLLVVILLVSLVPAIPVEAATYRAGGQSGASSSYMSGTYYTNYTRVPITGDNRTDVVAIALSQLGYQEGGSAGSFSGMYSGSSNYTEFNYNIGNLFGTYSYAWCASFVTWALYQGRATSQATYSSMCRYHSGSSTYVWKEVSVPYWVDQLVSTGYYKYSKYMGGSYTPQYGDLIFFRSTSTGSRVHVGMVVYATSSYVYTVEGNTSDSAGVVSNGGGVYFKSYSLSSAAIHGYGKLPYSSSNSKYKVDYSGSNPTTGLYISNTVKYIYGSETDSSYDYLMSRFTMFEVTEVCSNGRLKMTGKNSSGTTVTGYVLNNSDRVIQISNTSGSSASSGSSSSSSSSSYTSSCTFYPSYCQIKATESAPIYSQPSSLSSNGSSLLETASTGTTYTATGIYMNTSGYVWYRVITSSGSTGYVYSSYMSYVKDYTSDIKLSSASYPSGHVMGNSWSLTGTISSSYNYLTSAAAYVYSGSSISGSSVIGCSDTVNGYSYNLYGSTIDNGTTFGKLTVGTYTYAIFASYKNYHHSTDTSLTYNTGTVTLMSQTFATVASAASQASCSHSYTVTEEVEATCTTQGKVTKVCSKCGLVTTTTSGGTGHVYTSSVTVAPSCSYDGYVCKVCSICGEETTETYSKLTHVYESKLYAASCTKGSYYKYICAECGDSYTTVVDTTPLGHEWVDGECSRCGKDCAHSYISGVCSVCGMKEPDKNFYLFGWINGANYACEEDDQNTGSLKFVNGTLTATFSEVSYIGVKVGDNSAWYMTNGYLGDDATGGVFYPTSFLGANSDKLRVPKGRELTFTLIDNGDGSLTLSYVAAECEHEWADGVCTVCDTVCGHDNWVRGVCAACGIVCEHEAYENGKCTVCDVVCASHSYQNNVCTVCGSNKPNYDYYLFGYINGMDYGSEGDFANMGEYKFVNGKVVATFTQDSYVGVKATGNAAWYMTNGWMGVDCTSTTLYNTETDIVPEKLFVPGGAEITFTLVDNGDDTYVLSYEVNKVLPTLKLVRASLSFDDCIRYNMYVSATDLEDVAEMGLLTFKTQPEIANYNTATSVYAGYTVSGDYYKVQSGGVVPKELGDTVYFMSYAKLNDGTYIYSDMQSYDAVRYAKTILNSTTSSTEMKALVVAMLNFGAEAQITFGYKTDSLMNSFLTAEQQALVPDYSEDTMPDPSAVVDSKNTTFKDNGFNYCYITASFDSAFALNYYMAPTYTPDGQVTLFYWTEEDYAAVDTLHSYNASGVVVTQLSTNGEQYWGCISDIAAKEMGQTFYVGILYKSNGVTYTSQVMNYSLGKYCDSIANNASSAQHTLAMSAALYGNAAAAYFATLA